MLKATRKSKNKYKIVHVGEFGGAPYRDKGIQKSFEFHGCNVIPFATQRYFNRSSILLKRFGNLRKKLLIGVKKIKKDLIKFIHDEKPDIVFFRDVLLFSYKDFSDIIDNNKGLSICNVQTDMFSEGHNSYAWRQFKSSLHLFDMHFVFRKKNIVDFNKIGYKDAFLWEPSFLPWYHKPPSEKKENQKVADAVFVGHFEDDGREDYCKHLFEHGIDIKIHSTNWKENIGVSEPFYGKLFNPIYRDRYPITIYNSLVSLCFFSRLNNDKLTERVFEIPAMGGLLIAERNDRLKELFEEGKNILLFSDKNELLDHVLFVKNNPKEAKKIRESGYKYVVQNHSIFHRAAGVLNIIDKKYQSMLNN
jgi:spore maturation protein CgeB